MPSAEPAASTNRLAAERSPYLRQHADQPVDWFPWGDAAFAEARRTGRPVLLSIGYATCHWCHVMAGESFEDAEIAQFLNEHFVAIKVDREELPDVDAVYQVAVQALTGRAGGWPLTVFLTPDGHAFHGGTYYPARDGDRGVGTGFLTLLRRVDAAWREDPARFRTDAANLRLWLEGALGRGAPADLPGLDVLDAVAADAAARWDPVNGGAARSPKFPSDLPLRALLRQHQRTGDTVALQIATVTLDRMAAGGVFDQLDGGFHRYAVDAAWRVPHFEKTLYDNAQLAVVSLEVWRVTGDPAHREVARSVLDWLDRRMSAGGSSGGGWASAMDADGPVPGADRREEGRPYTWTPAEIRAALPEPLAATALAAWDVQDEGQIDGRSVLARVRSDAEVAAGLGIGEDVLQQRLTEARSRLLAVRDTLPQPRIDDKVVTAWNGLAIGAFARASVALSEPRWAARAQVAADAVWRDAWRDGALRRTAGGTAPGLLEDYALLAAGLVDLFEATGEPRWLERAIALDAVIHDRFTGPVQAQQGALWRTADDPGRALPRELPDADGVEPSGTSVHVATLYRLAAWTGDDAFRARGDAAMRAVAGRVADGDLAEMLLAVDWRHDRAREIVIVTPLGADPEPLLAVLRAEGPRNRVQVVVSEPEVARVARVATIVADKVARDGVPTAYVCERGVCRAPATTPEALRAALRD